MFVGDIEEQFPWDISIDYIFHGASATSSQYFVEKPVETIMTAINGTRNVLEIAKKQGIKSMVYLSSLEVYGVPNTDKEYVTEADYGYIDPTSVRSSYSEGKRMVECLCKSYMSEYGVPIKIARLSQTFGAGVDWEDSRVYAQFARSYILKKDIVLHTQGNTVRTYCYLSDAVVGLFYLLCKGENGEAYNLSNMNSAISILQMANLISELDGTKRVSVKIEIPEDSSNEKYNPQMILRLDSSKLGELGWKPEIETKEMFQHLIESMNARRVK